METVQLTKEEFAVIKEALEITERATLSEAAKNVNNSEKLVKFLKVYKAALEKDPKATVVVAPVSPNEVAKLKRGNVIKTISIVLATGLTAFIPGAVVGAAAGAAGGAANLVSLVKGGSTHSRLKVMSDHKEILKVSLIKGDGTTGKIKVAAYSGGKSKFISDAKKFTKISRIK